MWASLRLRCLADRLCLTGAAIYWRPCCENISLCRGHEATGSTVMSRQFIRGTRITLRSLSASADRLKTSKREMWLCSIMLSEHIEVATPPLQSGGIWYNGRHLHKRRVPGGWYLSSPHQYILQIYHGQLQAVTPLHDGEKLDSGSTDREFIKSKDKIVTTFTLLLTYL